MLSSRVLKMAILGVTLMAGGCDRQSGEKAQQQPSAQPAPAQPAPAPAAPAPVGVVDRSHRGSAMPEFTVDDPAGGTLRLVSLVGRPVLINLWATWCGPCVAELPMLEKLAKSGGPRVVTISQDTGDPAKVAAFLKDRGFTRLEPWLDPQNDLAFHYDAGSLPTTIYYDAKGREIWRFAGGHDWTSAETAQMLAETAD